jgi:hypothetical protein
MLSPGRGEFIFVTIAQDAPAPHLRAPWLHRPNWSPEKIIGSGLDIPALLWEHHPRAT